jgi:mannan polymerase complexes MNN9 subunit
VLWLDADIVESPHTLIQDLAAHDKPVIVPNCFQRYTGDDGKPAERAYDFNSWQDSVTAQELAAKMQPDELLLEGYQELPTYRTLMAYMELEDREDIRAEVPLDGVGGTALLVRADVHRDGAMFPPFPFYHLIETEGFAKMAKRLGWQSTGLPNYKVRDDHCCMAELH